MKKFLIFFFALTAALPALSQSIVPIRGDSVRMYKQGGSAELILENATRARTGAFLRNSGNGRTDYSYAVDTIYLNGTADSIVMRRGPQRFAIPAIGVGGGVSGNIYTVSGTLGANRVVAGGGNSLTFNGLSYYQVTAQDSISFVATSNVFRVRGLANATTGNVVYYNPSSGLFTYGSPDGGGAGGEDNFGENLGSGTGIYAGKVGVNLQFNSLNSAHFSLAGNVFSINSTIVTNATNGATAHGWGNHALANYLTQAAGDARYPQLSGSYANPGWITSLAYSKITGVPSFLTSETDPVARAINGILFSNGTTLSAAVPANFPTLNQNTSGSAATWTTGRTISATGDISYTSGSLNGSANVTGVATIAANAVTSGKFRQSPGLSVVGRSANTTGDVGDIVAGTDGDVLRRAGTTIGFGTIPQASVTGLPAALSAKLENITGLVTQGTNVTITGSGTAGSPYVINSTASGGGSGTVNPGTANRLAHYAETGSAVSELAAITANRALISNASGLPTHSAVTNTELGYVSGVTSSIQTQLGTKLSNITGLVTQGTNVTITGSGTSGSPYVINSTATSMVYPSAGVGISTGSAWAVSPAASLGGQLFRRNLANNQYEFFTPDYVNEAGARNSIVFTTTGTSGAATYNPATGALNIPNYTNASYSWSGAVIGTAYNAGSTTMDGTALQWSFTGASPATWTLPAFGSFTNRYLFVKNVGSANLTIQRAGTDNIYTNGVVTSVTVQPGESLAISSAATASGSTTWTVLFHSPALPGGGSSGANALASYIVQTSTNAPANAQVLASLGTGIVKNTTGTGALSIAVAGDFPTLNQNTSGSAATWTTGRTISTTGDVTYTSGSLNGSANVTGVATIAANVVTGAKFRQSAPLSVVGRAVNTTGDVADIVASTDGDVLRRAGTSVGFGTIPQASVTGLPADLAAKYGPTTALTGYTVGTAAPIAATDNILSAFGKVQAQLNTETDLNVQSPITIPAANTIGIQPATASQNGYQSSTNFTRAEQAFNKYVSSGTYSAGTITFTRNDATTFNVTGLPTGGSYTFNNSSIVNTSGNLALSNDATSPGNNRVYGTTGAGAKGWQQAAVMNLTSPTNGQILEYHSASGTWINVNKPSGGSGTPAGSDTWLQYNNAGAFGASANLLYDGTALRLGGANRAGYQFQVNGNVTFGAGATNSVSEITMNSNTAGSAAFDYTLLNATLQGRTRAFGPSHGSTLAGISTNNMFQVFANNGPLLLQSNGGGLHLANNNTAPLISLSGSTVVFPGQAGTGDRMLTVNASGVLGNQAIPGGGGGDVTKVGTPVDNQIGVWTGNGTIEGGTNLTYDGSIFSVSGRTITSRNASGTYTLLGSWYTPNLAAGQKAELILGKAESNNNRFSIMYDHVGDGNGGNNIGFTPFGGTPQLTITTNQVQVPSLAGTGDRMVVANSTGALSTQAIPGGGGGAVTGSLLAVKYLTTGTSYTPTAGTTKAIIKLIGGGGGGGGAAGANSNAGAGGGGGGGAYLEYIVGVSDASTYTYAIGAAGTAGAATGGNGGNGGTTSITIGVTYTAPGGSGGIGSAAGTTAITTLGGAGGTTATGDATVMTGGMPGDNGLRLSGTVASSGRGASNIYGGGEASLNTAAAGINATEFGAGGGGGLSLANVNRAGGTGTAGLIIIYEYK